MNRWKRFLSLTITLILLLSLFAGCSRQPELESPSVLAQRFVNSFVLTPRSQDENGVEVTSSFTLQCEKSLEERDIKQMVSVSPPASYTLERERDGEYELRFDKDLKKNTVYQVTVESEAFGLSRKFVFQTQRDFAVVSTLPEKDYSWASRESAIEFRFSVADVEIEDYFEITPRVRGRFETYAYTSVFVPDAPLEPDTVYTVTLSGELPCGTGQTLGEDYILSFRTDSSNQGNSYPPSASHIGAFSETYLPSDPVIMEFYAYNAADEFEVELYQYPDIDAYQDALTQLQDYAVKHPWETEKLTLPTGGLEPTTSFTTRSASESYPYAYSKHILFPEDMEPGYYLAKVTLSSTDGRQQIALQKLMQISDVSVYAQSLGGETLLWLHDGTTGKPLEGATVNLYTTFDDTPEKITTDGDGIAVSQISEETRAFFTVDVGGTTRYADRLVLPDEAQPSGAQMFYSMCYKDREIYMPSDTVYLWGTLYQRKERFALPEYVRVKLYSGYGWFDNYTPNYMKDPPLFSTDARLAEDGSYVSVLGHENLRSGTYYLAICTEDDLLIEYTRLTISDYIKPDYVIETEFHKPFYALDDTVRLSASVAFFDGTPAHSMRLHVGRDMYGSGGDGQYGETNEEGKITLSLGRPQNSVGDDWRPHYDRFRVISADAQNAQALAYANAVVIPRDVMMETTYTPGPGGGAMEITANYIDTSGITESAQIFENNYENIRGREANLNVQVTITREELVRDGIRESYYDFINKQTEYTYNYRTEKTVIQDKIYRLSGGALTLEDLPVPDGSYSYIMEITMYDTQGRLIKRTHYLYSNRSGSDGNYRLYFDTGREWGKDIYDVGEEILLTVSSSGREFDLTGTVLCTFMQEKILSYHLAEGNSVKAPFTRQMIPNVTYGGAFFDGRHVYTVSSFYGDSLQYNNAQEVLAIEVSSDKEQYRPGEQATLTLKVKDEEGNPVSGSLCVGVVDEAIFALIPQDIDPLAMLYRSVYSRGAAVTYTSYIQHQPFMDGGKGGGGDGEAGTELRDDFVDTALFWSTHTGEDGMTAVSFTVPDNLTSWRVTALAVDDQIRAGKTIRNVAASLPYFVKPVVNRRYLEGEDVVITAKVYGEDAPARSAVTVTLDGQEPQTMQVALEEYGQFNLGRMPAGSYRVVIAAESGDHKDAMALDFKVVQSFMELPAVQPVELDALDTLDSLSYPVTLAVFDRNYTELMLALGQMINYNPVRFEQKVAMAVAQDAVVRFAVDDNLPDFTEVSLDIAQTLQDPAETPAIARACIAAPDYIPTGEVANFLYARLSDRESAEEWAAAAFMGLAALNEPVLLDVRQRLKEPDLDVTQRLYYIAALAALGDTEGANAQYQEYIVPKLEERSGQIWLDMGDGNDAIYLHTSIAYYTALLTGKEEQAVQMLRYLSNMGSQIYTSVLENSAYVTRFQPRYGTESRFTYTYDGETNTVDLSAGCVKYLHFSRDSLAATEIEAISGNLTALAFYTNGPEAFVPAGEQYVDITKRISNTGSLAMGDLVDFTIDINFAGDAPAGWYRLTDFLPTNMRFFSGGSYNMYGGGWWNSYVFREQNQRLTLWVYYNPHGSYPTARNFSYTYTGRVMYTGRYVTESAYLIHENDLAAVRTPRQLLGKG